MNHTARSHQLPRAWVISVDMGYGHQRAAYPLKDIAYERIITANKGKIISENDERLWERARYFYEWVSRLNAIPLIGKFAFNVWSQMLSIAPFFPFRDLSKPTVNVIRLKKLINKGMCRSIIDYISKEELPVITTHFMPALAFHYNGKQAYCVVTDTDINRVWVPDNPKECRITYFSPCRHVSERLRQYGVSEDRIIETGFPLPKENIGEDEGTIKKDMLARLANLDPNGIFFSKYEKLVREKLGIKPKQRLDLKSLARLRNHPLTLTFAIGGAGAQKDIGERIIRSLKDKLRHGEMRLNIIVGTKLDIKSYYERIIADSELQACSSVNLVFAFEKKELFNLTNEALRTTDILWSKPSEMSFYTALGIPFIIAPPIGSHEHYNQAWIEHLGAGFDQENPDYVHDWLFYWLNDGRLADAALQGFIDAPRMGTYKIEEYLQLQPHELTAPVQEIIKKHIKK